MSGEPLSARPAEYRLRYARQHASLSHGFEDEALFDTFGF